MSMNAHNCQTCRCTEPVGTRTPDPRVKALVEAVAEFLDGDNWRLGRKFDPNSGNFDLSKQREALAALKGAD